MIRAVIIADRGDTSTRVSISGDMPGLLACYISLAEKLGHSSTGFDTLHEILNDISNNRLSVENRGVYAKSF